MSDVASMVRVTGRGSGRVVVSIIDHLAGGGGRVLVDVVKALPDRAHLVLCGDAIDTQEHLDHDIWNHCGDPEAAKASAEKLKRIAAEENATMLFGHDLVQWKTLRHAPEYYD